MRGEPRERSGPFDWSPCKLYELSLHSFARWRTSLARLNQFSGGVMELEPNKPEEAVCLESD
jgi:hypothetical protein